MLTKAGAKLLDFGLAKLTPTGPQSEASTKLADSLTQQGTILGTFQYMAPEQLEGQDADARTDIWAFGCVVYEMVTGQKAFAGKSQASLITAIMSSEPPPASSVEPMSPPGLDYVVQTCLSKDPDDRWQSSRDLFRELKRIDAGGAAPAESPSATTVPQLAVWQRPIPAGVAIMLALAIGGVSIWSVMRALPTPPPPITRTSVVVPRDQGPTQRLALSPDGKHLAYGAGGQLYLRSMDEAEAGVIPGTEGANSPFFSPDSKWLGYRQDGELKKIELTATTPVTLCCTGAAISVGDGSWGPNGTILFSQYGEGILQISDTGGVPEVLIPFDTAENAHDPTILPDGQTVLFALESAGNAGNSAQIVAQSLITGARHVVAEGIGWARYVPTGHLIYVQEGALLAAPFDLARLEVTGGRVSLLDNVGLDVDVSATGTLVYLENSGDDQRTLVWVDREGREEPLAADPRAYRYPRISPDGTRLALDIRDQDSDIWIWDFAREILTRVTFSPAVDAFPVWTANGQRLVFTSSRESPFNLYRTSSDGTGSVERLTAQAPIQLPYGVTSDGSQLLLREDREGGSDLRLLSLDTEGESTALLVTDFREGNGEFSPDDRWLAYQSDDLGQHEIYVRPFPNVDDGRVQISTGRGAHPLWRPDGRELLFRAPGGQLMGATVVPDASFSASRPQIVLQRRYYQERSGGRMYDISPDGQRFLMIKEGGADTELAPTEFHVVLNWFTELERLVPTP